MNVAGIDFSSRAIDVVLLDEDTDAATWHRFELTGQDGLERTRMVRAVMPGGSFWDDVLAVGVEDPRGYGAGALYRIQGAILACLPVSTLVQPWIPSSWRKTVGLPGNANKMAVAGWAIARWPNAPRPNVIEQDACDAYCIALATRSSLIEVGEAA